jgi:phosphatidylinositol alpha-1,6-mannosyltransferase
MGISHPIILLTHEFAPFRGGAATYCEEIALALAAQGRTVEIWTPGPEGLPDDRRFPFPVRRLGGSASLRLPQLLRLAAAVLRRRRELREKQLYLPSVGALLVVMHLQMLGFLRRIPVTITLHGSEILRFQRNPWLRLRARNLFGRAATLAAASPHALNLLRESAFSSFAGRCVVAPCALGSGLAATAPSSAPPPDHCLRILTLARLHPRKGQIDTARALGLLPPEIKKRILYQLAGNGDPAYLAIVLSICKTSGVPVEYLGEIPTDRMASVYRQCDIYALTSRTLPASVEGFGITYLEAGFFEKPVVGFRTGGVADAVRDGETGFLVEEGDHEALCTVLRRLIEDPALRRRLGQAGRLYCSRFDWAKSAEILFPPTGNAAS